MDPTDPSSPLVWREDGLPQSSLYGDVYFSSVDGLAETRAVFLQGCGLPERFAERRDFVVGELGFGSGLPLKIDDGGAYGIAHGYGSLAQAGAAVLADGSLGNRLVTHAAPLDTADAQAVTFFSDAKRKDAAAAPEQRNGRGYRELFQFVKPWLADAAGASLHTEEFLDETDDA